MHDVVLALQDAYLGRFEQIALEMRQQYPDYLFSAYRATAGPPVHGGHDMYDVGIECTLPDIAPEQSDNVSFSVHFYHAATTPRIMAGVVWGHPIGNSEAWLRAGWLNGDDWPEVSAATLQELEEAVPCLIRAFTDAVARGYPSDTPSAGSGRSESSARQRS